MYKVVFCFLIIFAASCADPSPMPTLNKQNLLGKWDLSQAFRNGKETETLRGAYFDFLNDSTMVTNILGNESPSVFYWQDSNIVVANVAPAMQYFVKNLTPDTLHLSFNQSRYQFEFILNPSVISNDSLEVQDF